MGWDEKRVGSVAMSAARDLPMTLIDADLSSLLTFQVEGSGWAWVQRAKQLTSDAVGGSLICCEAVQRVVDSESVLARGGVDR